MLPYQPENAYRRARRRESQSPKPKTLVQKIGASSLWPVVGEGGGKQTT